MFGADQIAAIENAMAEEHRKDLEALQRLKRFLPSNSNVAAPFTVTQRLRQARKAELELPSVSEAESHDEPVTIVSAVKDTLMANPEKSWTVVQMIHALNGVPGVKMESRKPEATVGLIFSKLAKKNKVHIIAKGSGRRPHVYKWNAQQEEPKK
jgi:hypothetical protein